MRSYRLVNAVRASRQITYAMPVQVPRSVVERYAHWLTYQELAHICAASDTGEQHARLCSRVLMRSAIATCLGEGIRLSVRSQACFNKLPIAAALVQLLCMLLCTTLDCKAFDPCCEAGL
jgi:hypothetical protein